MFAIVLTPTGVGDSLTISMVRVLFRIFLEGRNTDMCSQNQPNVC